MLLPGLIWSWKKGVTRRRIKDCINACFLERLWTFILTSKSSATTSRRHLKNIGSCSAMTPTSNFCLTPFLSCVESAKCQKNGSKPKLLVECIKTVCCLFLSARPVLYFIPCRSCSLGQPPDAGRFSCSLALARTVAYRLRRARLHRDSVPPDEFGISTSDSALFSALPVNRIASARR